VDAAIQLARTRSGLILVAALALAFESSAAADDPSGDDPTANADATAGPGTAITTVPAPPPAPAPLLPPRGDGPAGAPGGVEPDAPIPRVVADPRFGDAGQLTLNGALSASLGHLGYETGTASSTNVTVEPAFDYFASRDFSQGASVLFRYGESSSGNGFSADSTTLGLTVRVGRNLRLGGRVSFWPTLAFGVWRTWLHYSAPSSGFGVTIDGTSLPIGPSSRFTEDALFVELQAPVLLHLAAHFFVGFGPNAYMDVFHSVESTSNRRRFVGASSTIGGWF
jgi:hypothetical protein